MSWQATAWVSTVEAGGASGKLLLYALANYADENGRCYPGDERIMRDTELSERSVRDWKRKLEEAGLIRVERRRKPGGDFDIDIIVLAMAAAQPPANSAGGATGRSCRDHRQMTPPPPANGSNPPAPPYKAEPSEEPPIEPVEREREREGEKTEPEDRRAVEKHFERAYRAWPTSIGDSRPVALEAWIALSPAEREEAEAEASRYVAATKAAGRSHVCSHGVYLREKRWQGLPPREPEAEAPKLATPFSRVWTGLWIARCLAGPGLVPPARGYVATLIAEGGERGERERRAHQARYGFPAVNRMAEAAARGVGHTMRPDDRKLEALCEGFERMHAKSELAADWRAEFERRGWPWLPDPGGHDWFYFPAGGPVAMEAFEQAVRGGNDAGRSEAAE